MSHPFLSVITVVYNGENVIEKTLKSVISQKQELVEYIIIDGKSNDKTLEIIQKYKENINQIISEKDKGLYDAMNKGINISTGKYLIFMNAGDEFYDNNVVENLYKISEDIDVLYSDTMLVNSNGIEIGLLSKQSHNNAPENMTWKNHKKGMVVCHQSFVAKKEIISLYNLKYKLSSDIDWVIRVLKNTKNTKKVNFLISKFEIGGISTKKFKTAMKERYWILKEHFGFFPNLINHVTMLLRHVNKKNHYQKIKT